MLSKLLCKAFKHDGTSAKSFNILAINLNAQVKFFNGSTCLFSYLYFNKIVLSMYNFYSARYLSEDINVMYKI